MTREEAAQVLTKIAAIYQVKVDRALLDTWYGAALRSCDFATGLEIADDLAGRKDWMPKPKDFNELLAIRNRRNDLNVQDPVGGEWKQNPELKNRMLAEAREKLRG